MSTPQTHHRRPHPATKPRPAGITLVELLVAISILVVLMAVAARMTQFSGGDRKTREAARAISVYFSSAQSRALELGRPCGVMLRPLESRPGCVVGLEQVEVPPPYAGDTLDSGAKVRLEGIDADMVATLTAIFQPAKFSDGLVREHDRIQFNCQGPWYEIVDGSWDSDGDGFFDFEGVAVGGDGFPSAADPPKLGLRLDLSRGERLPWPSAGWSQPMPYQIVRRPVKSAASGLQLPARTVIDLEFSGSIDHSIGGHADEPVCIMFGPGGSLERIYHGHIHMATEPIFLLVGKLERIPAGEAEDGLANWQDLTNVWVTINPRTGLLITSQVAAAVLDPEISDPEERLMGALWDAREFALEAQGIGGR
jgi:hypothetical protein